jgi:hypothetical protein
MSAALTRPEQGHRLDHQGYAPEMWIGLLLTALYLMQSTPLLSSITDWLEFSLEALLALGCALCIAGSALGTRWCLPGTPKRTSYRLVQAGLPLIVVALAWYTYAAASQPSLLVVTLGGALGLCIEIASVRMLIDVTQELKAGRP